MTARPLWSGRLPGGIGLATWLDGSGDEAGRGQGLLLGQQPPVGYGGRSVVR
jgi:hypothetical protein